MQLGACQELLPGKTGGVGLVSPNCAGPKSEDSLLLSAGAGARYRAVGFVRECYDASEVLPYGVRASDEYALRMGQTAGERSAVFIGLRSLLRSDADVESDVVQLGACGDALHRAGMKTCVVGNADLSAVQSIRSTAVLAMDSKGIVDFG